MLKSILLGVLVFSSLAQAQNRPMPPPQRPPRDQVEERIRYLEELVRDHDYRLSQLEGHRPPPPPYEVEVSCLLIDSGYSKAFLGKGLGQLQAETEARQECGKSVHAMYCTGAVRCSSGVAEPGVSGYFCVLTDSGYGKTFSGRGADAIEAEYQAKQACQSSVHAMYCGNVKVRCEPERGRPR